MKIKRENMNKQIDEFTRLNFAKNLLQKKDSFFFWLYKILFVKNVLKIFFF